MGKREDQAKLRKKYKRNRYARFSGGQTKMASAEVQRLEPYSTPDDPEGLDHVRVKTIEIFVGKVSLSKQVVNGGKSSVNHERMNSYYERIRTKDQPLTIAEVFGVNHSKYQQVWNETPKENKVRFYSNDLGTLDMYWVERRFFFVMVDQIDGVIRRSRDYNSPEKAKLAERTDDIRWVETIPIK